MSEYFVIRCTEDGLTFDGPLSHYELGQRLAKHYYGDVVRFARHVPDTDGFCLKFEDNEILIIKGSIAQPKPVQMVTKWEIE